MAGLVESFVRHPAGESPVTYDRNDAVVLLLLVSGTGDPKCGGNGGTRVARAKGIVFALGCLRESAQAAAGSQSLEAVPAAGQQFVGIGLMADIPDDLIPRRIEAVVKGYGEFYGSQARRQVTTRPGNYRDYSLPDLLRQYV